MQLSVKGHQVDVGESLRTHVAESLNAVVGKYFSKPIEANVVFSRDAHLYKADVTVHVGRNIMVKASSEATEAYPAFDTATDKIVSRLRRYKRRLRNHHGQKGEAGTAGLESVEAKKYILEPEPEAPHDEAHDRHDEHDHHDESVQPVIVAEMTTRIETLTVGEAVMRMDLADLPALMFRNRAHGELNMVYRRADGNVGWIDPKGAGSQGTGA